MVGLDFMAARLPASSPDDRAEAQARVSRATVAMLAVGGMGAAVAARVPVVGALTGIAAGALLRPSPVRAMIGAIATAVFPPIGIAICGLELVLIGQHCRKRGFTETASAILGLGLDDGAMQPAASEAGP